MGSVLGLLLAALTAEQVAQAQVRPEVLRAHVGFLASDLLEGRGPGSRGDRLAQAYIAAQMESAGLVPAAPDGTYFQPVELLSIRSQTPPTLEFVRGGERLALRQGDEAIAYAGVQAPEARLEDAEVVFVGYGIVAPEYSWDDFEGADLRGKVLLMMNNDPQRDPGLFAGRTRLYYGRWDYKYESAIRAGAAAAIIIHSDTSAGYPWDVVRNSWTGEQFELPGGDSPRLQVRAWVREDAARRLVALAGRDLDVLREAAERRDFRPVPLGVRWSLALRNTIARSRSANVIGRLPGGDPHLSREAVVYTAHHDHLGQRPGAPGTDTIYNGAVDNASGVAGILAIARAAAALPERPRRSLIFAAVAAEEQGLLGSGQLAAQPPVPLGRMAAAINLDSMNLIGRTRDVTCIGCEKSTLGELVRHLAEGLGRVVEPDQFPDRGSFYRSDQFSLAKAGVPAAYLDPGIDLLEGGVEAGRAALADFEEHHYHQPSDELRPSLDFSGAAEDAQLAFLLGLAVANDDRPPAWRPGDEFEAARRASLASEGGGR